MEESINSKGFKSFPVLITFAIILDRYQAPKNDGPDLDPNYLTLLGIPESFFFFLKKSIQNY